MTPILYVRDFTEAMNYYTEKLLFDRLWEWGEPPDFGAVRLGKVEMSVGEMLEETFLHTFEKVSKGGVASPHTERTLSYIQELKAKHGIEYDTHASYRFVDRSDAG